MALSAVLRIRPLPGWYYCVATEGCGSPRPMERENALAQERDQECLLFRAEFRAERNGRCG
jgi:hypothetical protein